MMGKRVMMKTTTDTIVIESQEDLLRYFGQPMPISESVIEQAKAYLNYGTQPPDEDR